VGQVAGVRRGFGSDVAKLKVHAGHRARLSNRDRSPKVIEHGRGAVTPVLRIGERRLR